MATDDKESPRASAAFIESVMFSNTKADKLADAKPEVLANICMFEMKAKPYILEYFYKAGIGSFKSTGFDIEDRKSVV